MGFFLTEILAAIAQYETILKAKPNNEVALFALGQVYIKLRRFPEAIADWQKAAELYRQQGNLEASQDELKKIQSLQQR